MNQTSEQYHDVKEDTSVPDHFEVEIFQAGHYGAKGTYTIDDLDLLASAYDPSVSEAPITLDHQQTGPSQGWVSSIRRSGQKLIAQLKSVSPKLRELIARGSYKKRSIELYRNYQGSGKPYLKALSFLGAATPEVKGLNDLAFNESDSIVVNFNTDNPEPSKTQGDSLPAQHPEEKVDTLYFRQQLIDQQVWNPKWDAIGFDEFLRGLDSNEMREQFVEFLSSQQPLSLFHKNEVNPPSTLTEAISFNGDFSDESYDHHRKALEFQSQDPTISYVDALLRATSASEV